MPKITTSQLMTHFRHRLCWPKSEQTPAGGAPNQTISTSDWFPRTSRIPRLREKSRPRGLQPRQGGWSWIAYRTGLRERLRFLTSR